MKSRYRFLREDLGCDILTSSYIAFLNFLFGAQEGKIYIMHMVVEYGEEDEQDCGT